MNEPYVVTIDTPPAIVEADSRRSDEVRKRVQQIDSTLTLSFFELGDLLAEIKEHSFWSDWKFQSFPDYVKASGVDMSPRQVEYSIQISRVAKLLKINKTSLAKAKNSKLKEIFSLNPEETVIDATTQNEEAMSDIMVKLVEDAPSKTLAEIKEIVKRLKNVNATEDDVASQLSWLNWPVRRDAKQIIESTLEKAAAIAGQTLDLLTKENKDLSKAAALELVCADWSSDPNNQVEEFVDGEQPEFEDSVEDEDLDTDQDDEEGDDWANEDIDDNGGGFDVAGK